jgi:hypothetical protein
VPADAKGEHVVEVTFDSGPLAGVQNVKQAVTIH